ncbi:serine/threonine-protein kinase [Streptomyces sp. BI20]|uniref:serine/threonine-protein kinase n=1 Tax=Streptomyces sp. BI20 TaxID=3403460 RepID=UPI003C746840
MTQAGGSGSRAAGDTGEPLAGRYRLLEAIGRGGMGRVWRAHDELLHRTVAVKELTAGLYVTEAERAVLHQRTRKEARAAARIAHPSVVTVHDVFAHDERPWIVMEYIDGPSLADAAKAAGRIEPREAARIGLHVLGALRAAHAVGVLHRDVKPGNVLLARDGRVLLTDFGIAAIEGDTSITRTGELIGSLDYLAPERVNGGDPNPASDLWALGATLYTAVESRSPFRRTSPLSSLQAVVTEEPAEPTRAGALGPVITALLRKDPDARPTAAEVEQMLIQAMEGRAPRTAHAFVPTQVLAPDALGDPRDTFGTQGTRDSYGARDPYGAGGVNGAGGTGDSGSAGAVPDPGRGRPAMRGPYEAPPATGHEGGAYGSPYASPQRPEGGDESSLYGSPYASPRDPAGGDAAGAPGGAFEGFGARADGASAYRPEPAPTPAPTPTSAAVPVPSSGPAPLSGPPVPSRTASLPVPPVGVGAAVTAVADPPAGVVGRARPGAPGRVRRAALVALVAAVLGGAGAVGVLKYADGTGEADRTTADAPDRTDTEGAAGDPASTAPSAGARAVPPAGWREVRDPAGFTLFVPEGWTRKVEDGQIDYTPDGGRHRIRVSADPAPRQTDPYAHLLELERQIKSRVPDYRREQLYPNTFQGRRQAGSWEFAWTERTSFPGPRRGVEQMWLAADGTEYAVFLSGPDGDPQVSRSALDTALRGFRPGT